MGNFSVSGVEIQALASSAVIPAGSTEFIIKVSATPLTTGELVLEGVRMLLFGDALEEMLYLASTETKLVPKKGLEFLGIQKVDIVPVKFKLPKFAVIPAQPFLEIDKISLGIDSMALHCFEGELTEFDFTVKNVSSVPITYFSVMVKDQMTNSQAVEHGDDYERDVYEKNLNSCWVLKPGEPNSQQTGALGIIEFEGLLGPGETRNVRIGVFGKPNCTGLNIQVQYGNSDPPLYRRVTVLFVLFTVKSPIAIQNVDFLEFSETNLNENESNYNLERRSSNADAWINCSRNAADYCLITFDLYNSWTTALHIKFSIFDEENLDAHSPTFVSSSLIHGGVTKRFSIF